jgi:hypothetical protein
MFLQWKITYFPLCINSLYIWSVMHSTSILEMIITLVAEGFSLWVDHNWGRRLSLCDRKRWLNGYELLRAMVFLAQAGEVVLTPGDAFMVVTLEKSQNHLSCFGDIWLRLYCCAVKTKPNKINKNRNDIISSYILL